MSDIYRSFPKNKKKITHTCTGNRKKKKNENRKTLKIEQVFVFFFFFFPFRKNYCYHLLFPMGIGFFFRFQSSQCNICEYWWHFFFINLFGPFFWGRGGWFQKFFISMKKFFSFFSIPLFYLNLSNLNDNDDKDDVCLSQNVCMCVCVNFSFFIFCFTFKNSN